MISNCWNVMFLWSHCLQNYTRRRKYYRFQVWIVISYDNWHLYLLAKSECKGHFFLLWRSAFVAWPIYTVSRIHWGQFAQLLATKNTSSWPLRQISLHTLISVIIELLFVSPCSQKCLKQVKVWQYWTKCILINHTKEHVQFINHNVSFFTRALTVPKEIFSSYKTFLEGVIWTDLLHSYHK